MGVSSAAAIVSLLVIIGIIVYFYKQHKDKKVNELMNSTNTFHPQYEAQGNVGLAPRPYDHQGIKTSTTMTTAVPTPAVAGPGQAGYPLNSQYALNSQYPLSSQYPIYSQPPSSHFTGAPLPPLPPLPPMHNSPATTPNYYYSQAAHFEGVPPMHNGTVKVEVPASPTTTTAPAPAPAPSTITTNANNLTTAKSTSDIAGELLCAEQKNEQWDPKQSAPAETNPSERRGPQFIPSSSGSTRS